MTVAHRALAAALLVAAAPTRALPPNRAVALEAGAAGRAGAVRPALGLSAGWWLEGEVSLEARLALASVPGTGGRGTALLAQPGLGLRWAPDRSGWRPWLAAEVGLRLPPVGWGTALRVAARAGPELFLARELSLAAGAGASWAPGQVGALEGGLEVRCYF